MIGRIRFLIGAVALLVLSYAAFSQFPMYPVGWGRSAGAGTPSTLLTGLVAFYKMEENGANNRLDSSGNGNTLTQHSSPPSTNGLVGNAAALNVGSSGSWLDNSSVHFTNDFTVAFACKLHDSTVNTFTGRYSGSGHGWFIHFAGATKYIYFFAEGSTENGGNGITGSIQADSYTEQWIIIVATFRQSDFAERLLIYNNVGANLCDVTGNAAAAITVETHVFEVCGIVEGNNLCQGDFDNYGVWSRRLTDAEILEYVNGGLTKEYPF